MRIRQAALLVFTFLLISGCAAKPSPQPTLVPPTETAIIATEMPTAAPEPTIAASPTSAPSDTATAPAGLTDEQKSRAEELLNTACAACHSPSKVTREDGNAEEWLSVIQSMQARGAVVSDADALLLAEYLAQTYP